MMSNTSSLQARDLHDLLVPFRILSQCCLSLKQPLGLDLEKLENQLSVAYDHALNVLNQNLLSTGAQPSACRWRDALNHSRELLAATYPETQWRLKDHATTAEFDPYVAVPEAVLRRILVNLFDNAAKAQDPKHGACEIDYITKFQGKQPYLIVRISNPTESSSAAESGGFGLGLEIVSDLLARYCGTLHFQRSETMFLVELSLPIADYPPIA